MEYPILVIILAIATMFYINVSTAEAMEEKMEFELPESGTVINFSESVSARSSGGLDPPDVESSHGGYDARISERFEMVESGILIDFNRLESDSRVIGSSLAPPSAHSLHVHTAAATSAFQAFEMPESGHLIVFPHQVELRREQSAHMQTFEGVITDKR